MTYPPSLLAARRPLAVLALALAACGGPGAADLSAADAYAEISRETVVTRAVRRAEPSVLNLHTVKTTYDDEPVFGSRKGRKVNGMGTAVVVDPRGYLLTNFHVVEHVESIRAVDLQGASYACRVLSTDPPHDLALVKIDVDRPLPVMPLGTSCDLMRGETVIAIGNAFGYEGTVTQGIVSAIFRDVEVTDTQSYRNLIQTDAGINPGNSGGPLINVRGEVIGINVAIRAGAQRIGFAIPIDDAREVLQDLMSVERLEGRRHGLSLVDRKTPAGKQAVVNQVLPNTPAGRASLRTGDVVEAVGQTVILDAADFERALLGVSGDAPVTLTVNRRGAKEKVRLLLPTRRGRQVAAAPANVRRINVSVPAEDAKLTEATALDAAWDRLGCKLDLAGGTARAKGSSFEGGFRIADVRPGGPAAVAGLDRGDVVVGLHGYSTTKTADIAFILNELGARHAEPVKVDILRDGHMYAYLKLGR